MTTGLNWITGEFGDDSTCTSSSTTRKPEDLNSHPTVNEGEVGGTRLHRVGRYSGRASEVARRVPGQ